MQMTKHDAVPTTVRDRETCAGLSRPSTSPHLSASHIPFTLAQLSQAARLQMTYRLQPVGQDGQLGYVGAVAERGLRR